MTKKLQEQLTQCVGPVYIEREGFKVKFYSEIDGRLVCVYNMRTGKVTKHN